MTICSKLPSLQAHLAAQRKHWQGCRAWLVRIWSKMRGTRWGARKPNDEANFHTFCIIWDVIFLFRKYIRIYRNLTNRNMIPKFGKWYSYMFLFFDGKRPNGIGQRICNLRWCHRTWSLRRLATKLCFQYIQTRSSFLFCFTHIYNVWNILMAYIWFMQWLVQILYPYIYIYYAFIWNSVCWGRGEPFRIPCAQTASIFSATGEAVWVCMACIQSAQPSHALCVLDWGWRLDILSDHRF